MTATDLFRAVLVRALEELEAAPIPIYTFALYHDHESSAVSVCVDTEESSQRLVLSTNRYNAGHFLQEVRAGNLRGASLWQANIGRSLSLGDFARVNLARSPLNGLAIDDDFYLEMVRAVCEVAERIGALSPDPNRVIYATSGKDDEVAYVWSLPTDV